MILMVSAAITHREHFTFLYKPKEISYAVLKDLNRGMTSMEVAEYLLEHAKVALVPGSAFGSEGEGYLRISYACSYEDLQEAAKRIREAVAELKAR